MPLTTLIAEDEPLARDGLADWVQSLPQLRLLGSVGDGLAALAAIRAHRPDLVLMDIQLPGMTGLQVMRALAQDGSRPSPAVIFTTAYDEHALTAFELHAVDYLLKPFSRERFDEAVRHVVDDAEHRHRALPALEEAAWLAAGPVQAQGPLKRVLVRDGACIVPLQMDVVEHLRSDMKYTALTSQGRSYLVRLPIVSFEQRLDPGRFLKINRSCIVNLDFVVSMTPDEGSQFVVLLRDGTRVTASREVSKRLRADSL